MGFRDFCWITFITPGEPMILYNDDVIFLVRKLLRLIFRGYVSRGQCFLPTSSSSSSNSSSYYLSSHHRHHHWTNMATILSYQIKPKYQRYHLPTSVINTQQHQPSHNRALHNTQPRTDALLCASKCGLGLSAIPIKFCLSSFQWPCECLWTYHAYFVCRWYQFVH